MKLFSSILVPSLITILFSCSDELAKSVDPSEVIHSVSASLNSTKVAFNEEGKSEWEVSDRICVLSNGAMGEFETQTVGPSAVFNGELAVTQGFDLWAVYPYSSCLKGTSKNVTVSLPASQTVKPGSYANIVKIARSSSTDMFFYNACACLKIKLSQSGITRITLRSEDSSVLAGNVTYEWNGGVPTVSSVEEGSDIISIEPEGGSFQTDTYYYIAVLPTITGNYSITFEKEAVLGTVKKGPYAFKRNKNLVLDNPDTEAAWDGMTLSFDFTSSPNWDLCNTASANNAPYMVEDASACIQEFVYNNCYSSSINSGQTKYLVISKGYLGLPVLKGYRLSAVEMTLGNHNTKRYISVNSDEYAAAIVTDGGTQTEVAVTTDRVRYELPHSLVGQRYWLYSKSTFVLGHLKLWYEPASVQLSDVDMVISRAIADGTVPGAVLGIWKDGAVVCKKAYGNKSVTPTVEPMTTDVVFDMASCTKVMSTTIAVMQLYEQGLIQFDRKVSDYLTEFSEDDAVNIFHLMTHTSGLVRPTTNYQLYASNPQGYLEQTGVCSRTYAPGERYNYNCINFFVLQQIIERLTNQRLCDYAASNIFAPLGMDDTRYLPVNEVTDPAYKARIAPTSSKPSDTGRVNDTMARVVSEGNAGNAGVFSTLDDVLKFGQAILAGGELNGNRVLREDTVAEMSVLADNAFGRTLGWDCLSPTGYEKGSFLSKSTIFHTGYCGTLILVDRENNLCLTLLANRNHPQNTGYDAWNRYRGLICDIVGASLCAE